MEYSAIFVRENTQWKKWKKLWKTLNSMSVQNAKNNKCIYKFVAISKFSMIDLVKF